MKKFLDENTYMIILAVVVWSFIPALKAVL